MEEELGMGSSVEEGATEEELAGSMEELAGGLLELVDEAQERSATAKREERGIRKRPCFMVFPPGTGT